MVRGL
jgi:hypothetical protein